MKTHTRHTGHLLAPLRVLQAVAPSGIEITFRKYSASDNELSHGCGPLTAQEHAIYWRAKSLAAHGGVQYWNAAVALLRVNGWLVTQDE